MNDDSTTSAVVALNVSASIAIDTSISCVNDGGARVELDDHAHATRKTKEIDSDDESVPGTCISTHSMGFSLTMIGPNIYDKPIDDSDRQTRGDGGIGAACRQTHSDVLTGARLLPRLAYTDTICPCVHDRLTPTRLAHMYTTGSHTHDWLPRTRLAHLHTTGSHAHDWLTYIRLAPTHTIGSPTYDWLTCTRLTPMHTIASYIHNWLTHT